MSRRSVVIVGGGYAGVEVARALGDRADVTLISDDNFLLFTPMLAEVAGADIDPRHIVAPLRQLCPEAEVVIGTATGFDLETRTVTVQPPLGRAPRTYRGDALVLSVGSESTDFGIPGVAEWALPFKTIGDALRIRNRVISMLEEAAAGGDASLMSLAVIGAGYSGIEVAAAVNDFMAGAHPEYYPQAPPPTVTVIDALPRIAPDLTEQLSRTAESVLAERGIRFALGQRVTEVDGRGVILEDGSRIEARTVIWAAGMEPSVTPDELGLPAEKRRIEVDGNMRAAPGIFALGDAAAVPDGFGDISPPNAQHALRQGRYLGKHLLELLDGVSVEPYRYKMLGQFVSLGHRNAVGLIFGRPVSGYVGWFLWRTYYLFRLPTLVRKVRVALDWTVDLVFPPDIAQLPSSDLGPDAV
ncbi:MAG: NAD(P)/FAD-dependent oxidoreductase [Acidimicrobiia bacterium]|nr:NAD(P)/FAD-dependent oxidoreductase [Acidimicrobiia bacterium]